MWALRGSGRGPRNGRQEAPRGWKRFRSTVPLYGTGAGWAQGDTSQLVGWREN